MATRLAVTPFEGRLAGCFRGDGTRLAGLEDLRGGMKTHVQKSNGLENLQEEAGISSFTEEYGNISFENSGHVSAKWWALLLRTP
jgi:microcystin-dependent protein